MAELAVNLAATWLLILVPPVVLRIVRRTHWTWSWAAALTVVFFFANHIAFGMMTGRQSTRPFLVLGALATYFVLTWRSRASAADEAQARRSALGYATDDTAPAPVARPPTSWWRSRSLWFRRWAFLTCVWPPLAFGVMRLFDPFDWGRRWYGEDMLKALAIAATPVLAWAIHFGYRKVVQ